jgi:protein gp37
LFHDDVPDNFIGSVFDTMALTPQHTFQVLTKRPARARSLLRRWQEEAADAPHAGASFRCHDLMWSEPSVWPLPNVWLGVSAENQRWADIRVPILLETPAAVRWVSAEPLLGPLDVSVWLPNALDQACADDADLPERSFLRWIVCGGESGPGARAMELEWAWTLREQCLKSGTPFFMKQLGAVLAKKYGLRGAGAELRRLEQLGFWQQWPQGSK